MKNTALKVKLKLFLPVAIIIVAVIVVMTVWFVNKSVISFNAQLRHMLELEVQTITSMFERESMLKLERVQTNLNVLDALLYKNKFKITEFTHHINAYNQDDNKKIRIKINKWYINYIEIYNNSNFVDSVQQITGGTVTVFQRFSKGYVRMATNVLKADGKRAIGTYIPNDSPVATAINKGNNFLGRAQILGEWYITAYKPLKVNGNIVGMLYAGYKEKDIEDLKRIINALKIGSSGYAFVFDKDGKMLIHPEIEGDVYSDSVFWSQIGDSLKGSFSYIFNGEEKTMAYSYFEPFGVYIAASIINDEENRAFVREAVNGALIVAAMAAVLLIILVYYFTSKRLYAFFMGLQASHKKIETISEALKQSEERFQKLFDSTGDDIFVTDEDEQIVEVNDAACKTLGYSRNELLEMKITEIKSEKYRPHVGKNRQIIFEKGSHVFESEHISKDGVTVPVEFISRLVHYKNQKLILSVVRNLTQRREIERKILSTVISTEERERERFARDMHDGLGPLLSAVKLYVNELKSGSLPQEERDELINSSNELLDEAVNSTRNISNNLMPRVINTYGLIKAVDDFCSKVNLSKKISITFETENMPERLNHDLELILFRIISELINNTIKHAKAKKVLILLVQRREKMSLFFKDDGLGFDVDAIMNADKGMGLKNIISRVKSINGNYSFNSAPGKGFSIKIDFVI